MEFDFKELADTCQAEALANKLYPTDDAVWRKFTRQYSQMFNTPLSVVRKMEPAEVILEIYESQLEDIELDNNMEKIMDIIYTLEDPEYAKQKRDDLKQFIKEAEEEEEERLDAGKPIHKALADEVSIRKSVPKDAPVSEKSMPQSGGINLSYLQREETGNEGEEF